MFVDKTEIVVKSGDGGAGCCSFRREKFVPKGGPDGGDGGNGGDVIIESTTSEQNLNSLVYRRRYAAPNGPAGQGADKHGRNAEAVIIKVPVGTVIRDVNTGEILADLNFPGAQAVVAKGGDGGRGNARFATSTNRAPRRKEPGWPGEEKTLELELKLIADAGLVGYPNAGKSTLLTRISGARPKVAAYPFTTLHPVVGVVEYPDYARLTVADIPGLIDGAHANVGLGHEFLRHIERTKVLIYVLDMGGVDGRTPWDDYASLKKELELYKTGLSSRPSLIVANKMDIPEATENLKQLKEALKNENAAIYELSAGENQLGELPAALRKLVKANL
jgi:GTP-binding protein